MRYLIPKGTSVTVRKCDARPSAWQMHDTKRKLELDHPLKQDNIGLTFLHQGWYIYVPHERVEVVDDAGDT